MYYIAFGKFRDYKAKIFVDFFMNEENVKKINEVIPDGAKFKGAFLVSGGYAQHDFEVWYEIENYGVLDNWSNKNPKLKAFNEEMLKTFGLIAQWSHTKFLKPVNDVELIDPAIIKKD